MTINWAGWVERMLPPGTDEEAKLRSRFLVDIDCWSEARGQPIKPGDICTVVRKALA